MVKKEIKTAKKAVDTGQEKLAEGMAGVAVQQPSPDIGMKVPEIMNPPEGMQDQERQRMRRCSRRSSHPRTRKRISGKSRRDSLAGSM